MECEIKEELMKKLASLEKTEDQLVDKLRNKELNLLELRKTEKIFREERVNLKKKRFDDIEGKILKIPVVNADELKELEKRYKGLKTRKEEIEKSIEEMESKKKFKNNIKNNFLLKEKLQDYLYENEVLERYLRSESFRSLDEALIGYKHMIEELKIEKERLNEILKGLLKDLEKKKQEEYADFKKKCDSLKQSD